MKKAAAVAASALAFAAATAPAFAQDQAAGKPFPDVPDNHWAAQAVKLLQDRGIVIGYPDGTYGGPKAMTRYEFAEAIARLVPQIDTAIANAIKGIQPPDLSHYITDTQLDQRLQNYYTKPEADARFATKEDLQRLQGMIDQFRSELTAMGVDVNRLKAQVANLDARVTELEKLKFTGQSTLAWKTSAQFNGVHRGQVTAGVDRDGALLDNGNFLNLTAPGTADGTNASGKHRWLNDPAALYDTQVGIQYSPDKRMRAVAEFVLGNYYGAWHEQQAFSSGYFGETTGLLSNRQPKALDLQTYLAYLSVPFNLPFAANALTNSGISLGRIPTKMTQYTWWAVDPDTYVNVAREDSGNIGLTGAAVTGAVSSVQLALFGGYNPTDGTNPWPIEPQLDQSREGTIGFGHWVRPGGGQTPAGSFLAPVPAAGLAPSAGVPAGATAVVPAAAGVNFGNNARSHLLLTNNGGHYYPLYYAVPTLNNVVGARASLPWIGLNFVLGTGSDWQSFTQAGAGGTLAPVFNRLGMAYSADWDTTIPVHRLSTSMPNLGFQGEVAVSKTNNAGAYGVQTNGALAPGFPVLSTSGNATDYKLTFPIGVLHFALRGRSINQGFMAPGYWGQMGSWVNPWNYASDSPIYVRSGGGTGNWEVPLIPTEITLGVPINNVPALGDLGLDLNAGVGHMTGNIIPTPVSPSGALSNPASPRLFRISHAGGAVSFGAGPNSGYKFQVGAESVLRDYPESGGFSRDATLMWDAVKSLFNMAGGAGTKQPGWTSLGTVLAKGDLPQQSDENYYRFSVGKNLTSDGSAMAKLTLSRVVYTDRATPDGGGSYRGAVGTMQVTYKF